ncbi:hypothetical protein D9M70_558050 [compost metagenome]
MEELHTFLANHAIRQIPEHLQNPDHSLKKALKNVATSDESNEKDGQVLVSVDTGILTALISLKMAVSNADSKLTVCSKAIYWSKFAELVVRHIEDNYNSELQEYLSTAQQHANANHMESLIYETSA